MIFLLLTVLLLDQTFDPIILPGLGVMPRGGVLFVLFVLLISLAVPELARMFEARAIIADRLMLWLAATTGLALVYFEPRPFGAGSMMMIAGTGIAILFVLGLIRIAWHRRPDGAISATGAVLFSFTYLGILPGFYLAIRQDHTAWLIAAILLVTKSCDIGAYFTGRAIGQRKLIPWLSPGKTWEGLFGGMALAAVLAMMLAAIGNATQWTGYYGPNGDFVHHNLPIPLAAIAGCLLGALGQLGDLVASLLKRDAGLKDSGCWIRGFGGVLDVIDSPILVGPIAYWLLTVAGR